MMQAILRRPIHLVTALLAMLLLLSCSDPASVDDSAPIRVGSRPMFAAAAIQASLPGPTSYTINTSVSLPPVTNPTVAYLAVSGDISVYDNFLHPGTLVGVIPPGGGHQGLQTMNCYGQVQIWYQYTGSFNVGTDCEGGVRTTPIKMHGIGQASRGWGYPGASPPSCGYYPYTPCYYYTGGSQSITIAPINMELKLKPSKYVVTSGTSVTFTASGTPDSVYPYKLPFTVQSWEWKPDSGTASAPCSAGVTACTKNITVSGTMKVTALVNGEVKSVTAHVRVLCEFTSDSMLNNFPLLDAMEKAWGLASQGQPNDRRETTWSVNCDANGICQINFWNHPLATPCGSVFPDSAPPGWTQPGSGHIHPLMPRGYGGGYSADPVPPACGLVTPPGYDWFNLPGPSDPDYQGGATWPSGGIHCVMDPVYIYCFPMGVPLPEVKGQVEKIPRQTGACKLASAGPGMQPKRDFPDVRDMEAV